MKAIAAETAAEVLARRYHRIYEELAPQFGYATRVETREFDPESANGRLMIAVCERMLQPDPPEKSWAEGQDELDAIIEQTNTRVIGIPHPDMNLQVALTPDITIEEAMQAMRQLQSPTSVFVPIAVPPEVKTVGDFFGPAMGESIANQLADQIYGVDCSRCGEPTKKPVEVGARKLCAPCAALEY